MEYFNNNPYWSDIPKSKRIIIPYPNLFKDFRDKKIVNVLNKPVFHADTHFEIINKDNIFIPKQLILNNVYKVCILSVKYQKTRFNMLIDCEWNASYIMKEILNDKLGLNIQNKNNDVFNQYESRFGKSLNNNIDFLSSNITRGTFSIKNINFYDRPFEI